MYKTDRRLPRPVPLLAVLQQPPQAAARILGGSDHPEISGNVLFYQTSIGVLVTAEISGLPSPSTGCEGAVFGFHIHSGGSCTGTGQDPFADALGHYDPAGRPHPCHAGDLPPLLGNGGYAFLSFLTRHFTAEDILGKTVIIHAGHDDFSSQPGGNAGARIACGVIAPVTS